MKSINSQYVLILSAAVAGACLAGCEKQSVAPIQPAAPKISDNPTPEESFELIVETFRRGIEQRRMGFHMPREGGHSMMAGSNEVTHELVRPAKEGDPYKGFITVLSKSQYSIQRSTDRQEENAQEEKPDDQESESLFGDAGEPSGNAILDSDLVSTSSASGSTSRPVSQASENTVIRRPNESDRKYELIFKDGRWSLVTELDPETEQSIQYAFDYALNTQI
jgi:hypothetical protein